jgi:hypothetical protein
MIVSQLSILESANMALRSPYLKKVDESPRGGFQTTKAESIDN